MRALSLINGGDGKIDLPIEKVLPCCLLVTILVCSPVVKDFS